MTMIAMSPPDLIEGCLPFRPAFSPRACYLLRNAEEEAFFTQRGGAPKAKLIDWASRFVEPHQTFVDIGAHIGTWTQHFAQKCRHVHAFEPQRSTFARLSEGVKRAELGDAVTCHDVALGVRGEVDLHVISEDGRGTLRQRSELPPVISVERVRSQQLDDFTFDEIGLIKIDVEGYELDVLRGAIKTLAEHRPHLLLEAWTADWYDLDRAALIGYVESLGYRVQPVLDWPEVLHAEPIPPSAPVDLKAIFAEVETTLPEGGDWCSLEKALSLVTLIVGLRPSMVVELGVWMGGSAIPIAIALRHLGFGKLLAVDAWAREASVAGQENANAQWWGETIGASGHNRAFETFVGRLKKHGIRKASCMVRRQRTDEAEVPAMIDILHHDANHGPQAVADIERWAPSVRVGGVLVIDDLNWEGGHVQRARDVAIEMGFVELYKLGTGCVMQRVRLGA